MPDRIPMGVNVSPKTDTIYLSFLSFSLFLWRQFSFVPMLIFLAFLNPSIHSFLWFGKPSSRYKPQHQQQQKRHYLQNKNKKVFICTADTPWLNGKHTVFGKVTKGLDVVRTIEKYGTELGRPAGTITIANSGS